MVRYWAKKRILDLIPERKRISSATIFQEAKMSPTTVNRALKTMMREGILERVEISHKEVYYQRSKYAKLEDIILDIEELLKNARSSLKSEYEKISIDQSIKTTGEYIDKLNEISAKHATNILKIIEKSHDLLFGLMPQPFAVAIGFVKVGDKKIPRLTPLKAIKTIPQGKTSMWDDQERLKEAIARWKTQ